MRRYCGILRRWFARWKNSNQGSAVGGQIDATDPTTVNFVGTASRDFVGEDGALAGGFTYKLDSEGTPQTRNIRRFGNSLWCGRELFAWRHVAKLNIKHWCGSQA